MPYPCNVLGFCNVLDCFFGDNFSTLSKFGDQLGDFPLKELLANSLLLTFEVFFGSVRRKKVVLL